MKKQQALKPSKYKSTGRLKLIEQQLLAMDASRFQSLCDVYLFQREQELVSLGRSGSKLGKDKVTKGTPDTFFRLADGKLGYAEYTTKSQNLVVKIKEDIDKCLNYRKTGIARKAISKIVICFNSTFKEPAEEAAIMEYAYSKRIRVELIDLGRLAIEIYSKHLILAKDFLGIPLDTGQLLPLTNFIKEYNNKGGQLSTPLDNVFFHRETELLEIAECLAEKDILIVSGPAGVGKTKIALEACTKFLESNKRYSALVVSKKDQDISEDLRIHLQQEKDHVLLVDDANRQLPNFKQILGIFRENRVGNLKLIVTVRDYALNDVITECGEFNPHKLLLKKFSDKEVTDLISSDSFEIRNSKYQKKIIEVADGNARLAIMASRLAREKQASFLLGTVSDLYDSYFQMFIKDFDLFSNNNLLKTLGIVSFFYTIDRNNKKLIDSILAAFDLDYYRFNEALSELHSRELIEIQFDNARISEQVMATYFFYKVFIKDKLLSFNILLFNFFPSWQKRFSDTIIPANNSFGYDSVVKSIRLSLSEYLNSIQDDEDKVITFLSSFWFYLREEAIAHFYEKINQMPEPTNPEYHTQYEMNDFAWNPDKTLSFLSNFFMNTTESYVPALELAFEYARKKLTALPELIKKIRERILFDDDDYSFGFKRQTDLFELIFRKLDQKNKHYLQAFFALAETYLAHYFHITQGGRKHTISFYDYPLPLNKVTKRFRKNIWEALFENFESHPTEVTMIIRKYDPGTRGIINEILAFDLSYLMPFIKTKLDSEKFEHIYCVHSFVSKLDLYQSIKDTSYRELKILFNSKEFECYKKLDWNQRRGRQDFQFKNREEFNKLKEADIRKAFQFSKISEFDLLFNVIHKTLIIDNQARASIQSSLNVISEETFKRHDELGFQFLERLLNKYPKGLDPIYTVINEIVNRSSKWASRLWKLLGAWEHETAVFWKLTFFSCLPQKFCNVDYKDKLLETVEAISVPCYLPFKNFEKFEVVDKGFIIKLLQKVVSKIESTNLRISLDYHFFERYSELLVLHFDLLSKAYIQQAQMQDHFDHEGSNLQALLKIKPGFIINCITVLYRKRNRITEWDRSRKFAFIWDINGAAKLIGKCMDILITEADYIGIAEHPANIFFQHLNETQKDMAKKFILSYIKKYNSEADRMNPIFDIVRHSMKPLFAEAFTHYLKYNRKLKAFEKIWWIGNGGGVYSGNVIIGDIHAKEWQDILQLTDGMNNQLELIPIRAYLKKQVQRELQYAETEKKRKFIDPDY